MAPRLTRTSNIRRAVIRIASIAITLGFVHASANHDHASASQWTSQWRTSLGTMNIENLPEGQVYGEWSNKMQKAEIRGWMQADGTFKGHWYVMAGKASKSCREAQFGTRRWGPIDMSFNRADLSFTGRFGYCRGNYEKDWRGEMVWSKKRGRIR